jgi:nucleoside-diphosphate-sugar epimerase
VSPRIARDYVYVDDAVDAFVLAAATDRLPPGAVFNVGTGTQTSLQELVEIVREQFAIEAAPQWGSMPDRHWDTDTWVASPDLIRTTLGWKPATTLDDGIRAFASWLTDDAGVHRRYETTHEPPT